MNLKARAKKLSDFIANRRRILLVSSFVFVFLVIILSSFLESVSILNKTTVASIISILSIIGGVLLNLIINDIPVTAMLRFLNILRSIAFVVLGILPLIYIVLRLSFLSAEDFLSFFDLVKGAPEQALVDTTMAGLAATVFGIAAGVPVAFWLSSKQQQAVEAKEKMEEKKESDEREKFILTAIHDELGTNLHVLVDMINKQKKYPTILSLIGMKDTSWQALSDSGELKWINDLAILLVISRTYHYIELLIHLEKQYVDLSDRHDVQMSPQWQGIVNRVHDVRPIAYDHVIDARREIEKRMRVIESESANLTKEP